MTTAVMDETQAVFSAECYEPKGVVVRSVYPMPLTAKNLGEFWNRSKDYRTLFDTEVSGDFKKFCEMFISMDEGSEHVWANGLFWRIDDFVGVFYMTHIQSTDAQIHYSFFDRRHHGRQSLTRAMIKHVFDKYKFRRLSAEIPYFANGTHGFVQEVGLVPEGRKRKAACLDNEWFDVKLFGILREEADAWG